MRLFGWEGAEGHEQDHLHFFVRLDEIERRSLTENISSEMVTFLESWLTGHIMVTDKAYARHILSGAPVVASF
jgi:hemerythrin